MVSPGRAALGARLFGRYLVRERIGDGAIAVVYRADDEITGAPVALKIFDSLRAPDPIGRARFEREFDVLRRIDHPGVGRAIAFERDPEAAVLILEHIAGPTLRARLLQGRLGIAESLRIVRGLARALEACHKADVLHRDLKPENVILNDRRGPVIVDFGLAWYSSAMNLTRTGALIGSPQYLAPEVFSGALFDTRADLYSLAAIFFEMLTGRPVNTAQSIAALAAAHGERTPPRADALRPEIGRALADVIARALEPEPEDRYATIRELLEALDRPSASKQAVLQQRLPCASCGTPTVPDLHFCGGCGRDVDIGLRPGAYAVRITAIADALGTKKWLDERHLASLRSGPKALARRLFYPPVALVGQASLPSAERLAREAEEAGCTVEIVRSQRWASTRLALSSASVGEIGLAFAAHAFAVLFAGAFLAASGASFSALSVLPMVLATAGVLFISRWIGRPLLRAESAGDAAIDPPSLRALRGRLAALETKRARGLAAGAIARAVPAILGWPREGEYDPDTEPVIDALGRAIEAAEALDVHARALRSRSRTGLAQAIDDMRAQADHGVPGAQERLASLEAERREYYETAIAHDLASRQGLECCEEISALLR